MAEPYKLQVDPYEDDADAPTKVGALAQSGMRPTGPTPVIFYEEDDRLDPSGLMGGRPRQEHTVVMPISPTIKFKAMQWPAPPGVIAPAPASVRVVAAPAPKAAIVRPPRRARRSVVAVVVGLTLGLTSALAIGVALLFFFE